MNRRATINVFGVVAVLVVSVALSGSAATRHLGNAGSSDEGLAGDPDQLARAVPGNEDGSDEGPGGAGAAFLASLAYPDTDIPLERLTQEASAARIVKGKLPKPGSEGWGSVGPSTALYPLSPLRTLRSYVPNEYAAASRIDDVAIAPTCQPGNCRMWIGPAGGGVWRTNDALATSPSWTYLSGSFGINSIGAIALDPTDQSANTIWVGTGEGNSCNSGCVHGVGLYRSTDGGNSWQGPIGGSAFNGRGITSIAIDPRNPNVVYAGSTRGVHGYTSVCCSGNERIVVPGAALWGVYKSTDGGATWTYIHAGAATTAECGTDIRAMNANNTPCTPVGSRQVVLDPSNPDILYASSYARGVWRSTDGGATWTQIKASLNSTLVTTLPWAAVTRLANGDTRMYVSEGHTGAGGQYSRVFRSDKVQVGSPTWSDLTSADPADSRWGTFNFCTGQCWYDNFVYTPRGNPDVVYVGGSYSYGERFANHRAVVLSTDAGSTWTDVTADATDPTHPNALHPDQHVIVTNPGNPFQFWEGSDGGMMRSSGAFANVSSWCDSRGLEPVRLDRCRQMLSRVPTQLTGINQGLTTLQFQSLSVSPFDSNELQGGTQDNGTWENYGKTDTWLNVMIGDGGQSGFDVADPHFRFSNFTGISPKVSFNDGAMADWIWIGDVFNGPGAEAQEFYSPMISDPTVSRTLFAGAEHVWRTKTHGRGSMSSDEFGQKCNYWTGEFRRNPKIVCGDWEPLGAPKLTDASLGTRSGGDVVAVSRTTGDTSTLWAATGRGRVFVSKNADADPASAVSFTRIDTLAPNAPNRFVSGISVDPANPNHAWVSYTGFSANTPSTPGHVFDVTYDPAAGTATWVSLDGDLGDLPITAIVRDHATGTLYAGTDYGVIRLDRGDDSWELAAEGMPNIEVPGLTIVSGNKLYAATHGMGAWVLNLQHQ